ncbi:signal protein PDZ [Campylobacter sp. faydin G-24]|uniref:Signal protein PDZ n=1 Tax=Campylobacter anatolicus TaxID=2829105 RepID=A0ABS5HKA0_9BACT|nr:PDZ domain-containing protein [Campylobacter anatolicus]MBR8464476.1 signal protein PDZ [Campylobacter anatolicus]
MSKFIKFIVILATFATTVLADPRPTQDDFNACYEKNKNSIISVNRHFGVAITKDLIAVPKSSSEPINNYVKFDPYLQLYLVRSNESLQVPMMADETDDERIKKSTWIGILSDNNNTKMGHIKQLGVNLGDFDTLSFEHNATGMINTPCCKMIGIAIGGDKFIPNRYLKHFAAYDDVYYGDIGVNFYEKDSKFYVGMVDPLGRGKMLMVGDELISINGKKPKSLRELNETILFAPKGAKLDVIVQRELAQLLFQILVSGDLKFSQSLEAISPNSSNIKNLNAMPDTITSEFDDRILIDYGINVNKNLVVTKVAEHSNAQKFGIKIGDKILQIDKQLVKNRSELAENIGDKQSFLLLFSRGGFQFFARAPK